MTSSDVEVLSNSIKGKKKDETQLIKLIIERTNEDRRKSMSSYNSIYNSDLIEDLKKELSGDFEDAVLPLFYDPIDYDCMELKKAMKGLGTYEGTLIEIITNRDNSAIRQIKERYPIVNSGSDLIKKVKDDTSGNFKNTLVALLEESREEDITSSKPENEKYARKLYENVKEATFLEIFTQRSQADFIEINNIYYEIAGKTLLDTVQNKFQGDFKNVLVGIYFAMVNPAQYFAKRIHDSIYGLGTYENTLIRVIVTRNEKDLYLIREVYKLMYDADMVEDIKDDTSGNFRVLLVSLVLGEYTK